MVKRKICIRRWSWYILTYYPKVCLERLNKTVIKAINQDSRSQGQTSNQSPPEYEAETLIISLRITPLRRIGGVQV
jgi:hypothetical protein